MLLLRIAAAILLTIMLSQEAFTQPVSFSNNKKTEIDYFWETKPDFEYIIRDSLGRGTHWFLPSSPSTYKVYLENTTSSLQSDQLDSFKKAASIAFILDSKYNADKVRNASFREIYSRYLREWGIQFWKTFPNDLRRFDWLVETMRYSPVYFSNTNDIVRGKFWLSDYEIISIDTIALNSWNVLYKGYHKELMASGRVSNKIKLMVFYLELQHQITDWRRTKSGEQFDYLSWIERLITFDKWYKNNSKNDQWPSPSTLSNEVEIFLNNWRLLGLSYNDLQKAINQLEASGVEAYKKTVQNFKTPKMMEMIAKTSLVFGVKSEDGKSIELENFKGRLVYVDFWSLGCSSCIAAMPKTKEIFEKYKKYGFEVISACFVEGKRSDGKDWFTNEKARIAHVHEKLCGDWPLVLLEKNTGEKQHRIRKQYEFNGNPNLFLFDENGKLLHYQGELMNNLEAVVRDHYIKQGKIKN